MYFMKPKGQRIKTRFIGVSVNGLWYDEYSQTWATIQEHLDMGRHDYTNIMRCRSYRAFKRFVRKHPQFKGNMWLQSRFVGHDVYA